MNSNQQCLVGSKFEGTNQAKKAHLHFAKINSSNCDCYNFASLASTAVLVSSKLLYFPVPMSNLDSKERPAIINLLFIFKILSSTDCPYNFYFVTVIKINSQQIVSCELFLHFFSIANHHNCFFQ